MIKNNVNRLINYTKVKTYQKVIEPNFFIKREDLIFEGIEIHNIILYCLIVIQKKKNYIITPSKDTKIFINSIKGMYVKLALFYTFSKAI